MRTTAGRAIQWTAAALLLTFAAAKLVGTATPVAPPQWLQATRFVAAAAETALAGWLLFGGASARPVAALAVLGATFVAASVLVPDSWLAGDGCGCLGAVRLEQGHRVVVGSALMLLAGICLALAPPGGTRGATAAQ